MSFYTLKLRELIQEQQEEIAEGLRERIDIGLNDYPIYDESYRETLNKNIIGHYMFREIGYETPEMFIMAMRNKMHLIMPRYNDMYLAYEEEYDLLENVNYTEHSQREIDYQDTNDNIINASRLTDTKHDTSNVTDAVTTNDTVTDYTGDDNTTTHSDVTGNSSNKQANLDNPMGSITDIYSDTYASTTSHGSTTAKDVTYGTQGTKSTSNTDTKNTVTTDNKFTGDEQSVTNETNGRVETLTKNSTGGEGNAHTKRGKDGSMTYTQMIAEYVDNRINIDEMIIKELSPLFMGLWGNGGIV